MESLCKVRNQGMYIARQFISSTDVSVFLTGKAGTGKTTFLRNTRESSPKRMVVLAPTGVAAINAGGQTIHSFFQLPFGPYIPGAHSADREKAYKMPEHKKNLIRSLDLLVIDEVSMVRADLLDQIDDAMRRYRDPSRPFGGVQLLLIGDLMQLSPVAKPDEWALLSQHYETPYFFSSHALRQISYVTIELNLIYRQRDEKYINLLGKIRDGNLDQDAIDLLNSRYVPDFKPDGAEWIRLTTHNHTANSYNERQLDSLPAQPVTFNAAVTGDFPESSYPADTGLTLKKGAQVMFIKNDSSPDHAYYNGKIGTVSDVAPDRIEVQCAGSPDPIQVAPAVWENNRYTLDPATKEIREEVAGTFSQYPLRLAWAITVHKSQGLTFDHAVLDINASFAHGQTYVALSRCRTLEGLVLSSPVTARSVITDRTVNSYIDGELAQTAANVAQLDALKMRYSLSLLDELYDFSRITQDYEWLLRVVDEHLSDRYPKFLIRLKAIRTPLKEKISDIALRFRAQYYQTVTQDNGISAGSALDRRIRDSCRYFGEQLAEQFGNLLAKDAAINIENKQIAEKYNNAVKALRLSVTEKSAIFNQLSGETFSTSAYLNIKAKAMLDNIDTKAARRRKTIGDAITERNARKRMRQAARAEKAAAKAAAKAAKTAAPDTFDITLDLYRQGLSVNEIAKKRGLKPQTITNHLARWIERGEINADDLVSPAIQRVIRRTAASLDRAYKLSELRELLPPDITYDDIRITLAAPPHPQQ